MIKSELKKNVLMLKRTFIYMTDDRNMKKQTENHPTVNKPEKNTHF